MNDVIGEWWNNTALQTGLIGGGLTVVPLVVVHYCTADWSLLCLYSHTLFSDDDDRVIQFLAVQSLTHTHTYTRTHTHAHIHTYILMVTKSINLHTHTHHHQTYLDVTTHHRQTHFFCLLKKEIVFRQTTFTTNVTTLQNSLPVVSVSVFECNVKKVNLTFHSIRFFLSSLFRF